jgi:hypothetical protein
MPEDWPFDQEPNVVAITTRQVIKDGLPILNVEHYLDDHSWAFVCGTTDRTEDGRVISMGTALKFDPTLRGIADLPPGGRRLEQPGTDMKVKRNNPDHEPIGGIVCLFRVVRRR